MNNTITSPLFMLAERILDSLKNINGWPSKYIMAEDTNGHLVKIRISDHSGKKQNNGDTKTLSFITKHVDQGYSAIANEWVVDLETELTDTFQPIEEVLEWEGISGYYLITI